MATHYQQTNLDSYNSDQTVKISWKIRLTASCRSLKVDGKLIFERDMAMLAGYARRWNHVRVPVCAVPRPGGICNTILLCCNQTITACSATALMAVSTVCFRQPGRPASAYAFMMMPPLNVLTFLLVKICWLTGLAPAMTTLNGRMTVTKPVRWFGQATLTGVFQNAGGCVAECSTIPVWMKSVAAKTLGSLPNMRRDQDRLVQLNTICQRNIFRLRCLRIIHGRQYKNGINGGRGGKLVIAVAGRLSARTTSIPIRGKPADQMLGLRYNSCCFTIRVGYENVS